MQKITSILLSTILLLIVACDQEDLKESTTGKLSVSLGIDIKANPIGGRDEEVVALEDFVVVIQNEDGTTFTEYTRAGDVPAEIELPTGVYRVIAYSDNEALAAFDNPHYYGQSELFSIDKEELKQVTVICTLANMKVTVIYSDNVINTFDTYSTTVQSDAGGLIGFNETETREAYFSVSPLSIEATLNYNQADGSVLTKTFIASVTDPQPKTHYDIQVDAVVQDGQIVINLVLDESLDVINIELRESISTGNISFGELLITEVMQNPAMLSDAEGEYFEIYNTTNATLNLNGVVVSDNGTDRFVIQEDLLVPGNSFYVFSKSENATNITNEYIYSDEPFTLANSDDEIVITNADMSLIVSLAYDGGATFPNPSGRSMILNQDSFNAVDAQNGGNWCESTSTYSTGELGTPGTANDSCL